MKEIKSACLIASLSIILSGCDIESRKATGVACLGANNSSLVERLENQCKAGDTIATKNPAYFCDFDFSIAYNDYNSAFCVYTGKQAEERVNL